MSNNTEKVLKQLKEICSKIETEKDCSKHVADLQKYLKKGAFYEYHTFMEFLDIFSKNSKIPDVNKKEILKLLDEILRVGSDSRDACITRLYNFLLKQRERTDLINDFIFICNFETEPKISSPEFAFQITEFLLRSSQNTEQRRVLYRNYKTHLANNFANSDLSLKLLQSFHRCIKNLGVEKKWNVVLELLNESFLKVPKCSLNGEETHMELLKIFFFLVKFGQDQEGLMKACGEIAENFSTSHHDPIEKTCYKILASTLNKSFTESELIQLRSMYKTASIYNTSLFFQRTTQIVAKNFTININKFEMTSECFAAYHGLVVSLFHVFKCIKNEEGHFQCCTDVKRHEVHHVIVSIFNYASKLIEQEKFTATTAKHFLYHFSYNVQILKEMKCKLNGKEMLNTYGRYYNVVYKFSMKKSLVPELIQYIHEYIKMLFKVWNLVPAEEKTSSTEPDALAWNIYDNCKKKETAVFSANGIASPNEKIQKFE